MEEIDYSKWDKLNVYQKCITYGRLLAMKEQQEQMSCIQESFTRLLKVNGIEDEEYFKELCQGTSSEAKDADETTEETTNEIKTI